MEKDFDGIKTVFPDEMPEEEAYQYVLRGKKKFGSNLRGLEIELSEDKQDALLHYDIPPRKFTRIARITGYLVGTMDRWNNAKRAEEHDRVKHEVDDGDTAD